MSEDKEIIQIDLGKDSSLDLIKTDDYVLFVISERSSVQRRTVVSVTRDDALAIVRFIMGIK